MNTSLIFFFGSYILSILLAKFVKSDSYKGYILVAFITMAQVALILMNMLTLEKPSTE